MVLVMTEWSFLTNHARVLVCIAHDPGVRLRDIATTVGITERSAYGIVTDLTAAGYVVKDNTDGRRNRYQIQTHLPLRDDSAENGPSARSWTCSSTTTPTNQPDTPRLNLGATTLASQPAAGRSKPSPGTCARHQRRPGESSLFEHGARST